MSFHIDITTVASQLKPLENKLLMKIIKKTKEITAKRICDNDKDVVLTTMPDNESGLNLHCLRSNYSILKNMPTPKCVN